MTVSGAVEHVFRHEYGRLVASLVRKFGTQHIELAEDAVQFAISQAVEHWPKSQKPSNPAAWLYQVSFRFLLTELRKHTRHKDIINHSKDIDSLSVAEDDIPLSGEMTDDMLKMLFAACQPNVPVESLLVFTLKSLCGFSVKEVSTRLFMTEANVYKRYSRCREYLKTASLEPENLSEKVVKERLPLVLKVIYLVFTEGYLSSHENMAIRIDLCDEGIRLGHLLAQSAGGDSPQSYALLALMYLHRARMHSRYDDRGKLLLLSEQDRELWDKEIITIGMQCLQYASQGDEISHYHIEAGIAAEHCLSSSFSSTRWSKIAEAYALLEKLSPSPLYCLNRAVAIAEIEGPTAGLKIVYEMNNPAWMLKSYHWHAVLADLLFRSGSFDQASEAASRAIDIAPSFEIQQLLTRRFQHHGYTTSKDTNSVG